MPSFLARFKRAHVSQVNAGIEGGGEGRDCKWQMCCCIPCTLCLIKRQLTYHKRKGAALGAPPAADAIEGPRR